MQFFCRVWLNSCSFLYVSEKSHLRILPKCSVSCTEPSLSTAKDRLNFFVPWRRIICLMKTCTLSVHCGWRYPEDEAHLQINTVTQAGLLHSVLTCSVTGHQRDFSTQTLLHSSSYMLDSFCENFSLFQQLSGIWTNNFHYNPKFWGRFNCKRRGN